MKGVVWFRDYARMYSAEQVREEQIESVQHCQWNTQQVYGCTVSETRTGRIQDSEDVRILWCVSLCRQMGELIFASVDGHFCSLRALLLCIRSLSGVPFSMWCRRKAAASMDLPSVRLFLFGANERQQGSCP